MPRAARPLRAYTSRVSRWAARRRASDSRSCARPLGDSPSAAHGGAMRKFETSSPVLTAAAAFALVAGFAVAALAIAADKPTAPSTSSAPTIPAVHSHILVETILPDAPGKALTMAKLTLDPGAAMNPHVHTGSVIVYVLSGNVRL